MSRWHQKGTAFLGLKKMQVIEFNEEVENKWGAFDSPLKYFSASECLYLHNFFFFGRQNFIRLFDIAVE